LFEEALALDPKYYWPQVMLGYTYQADARFGCSETPARSIKKALECAQKALALDNQLDPGHSLLAIIYLVMRQHDKTITEGKRAVDLNPNGAYPISMLAAVLGAPGEWEQSILFQKQSMSLNPIHNPWNYYLLGRAQFMTGKFEESVTTLKKTIKTNPNYQLAHILLAANYGSLNRDAEVETAAKEIMQVNPHFTLEAHAKTLPYKNKTDIEREVAALRKAGLK
jgi:adenylate cyclase